MHISVSKKRKENATNRMNGQSYLGFSTSGAVTLQNSIKPQKEIGVACSSAFCLKSKLRHCNNFDEETRHNIFKAFWSMNWQAKRIFIKDHVSIFDKKRCTVKNSKKKNSFVFKLPNNQENFQVCQVMFLSTLSVSISMVRRCVRQKTTSYSSRNQLKEDCDKNRNAKNNLKNYFKQLDTMESHYCRKDTRKKYIADRFKYKAQLFTDYAKYCAAKLIQPVSIFTFSKAFKEENLSLYKPRKDQCDKCVGFTVQQISDKEYYDHISKKERAQLEKRNDKILAQLGQRHVFTMDTQAVKLCPNLNASAIYYKQRLQVHNFTVYNIATHQCTNYWWSEINGNLSSSSFISCILHHLQTHCLSDSLPITIFSDGCGYQNRNHYLSNALSLFAIKHNKIIEQKFLEKGHTQMECDSAHAKIEKNLKNQPINLPIDYVTVTKGARKTIKINNQTFQKPFDAIYLNYDFFYNYADKKLLRFSSIRPGRTKNEPTVSSLRSLLYLPSGDVKFKINFDEEYVMLPTPIQQHCAHIEPMPLHSGQLAIHPNKWKHLQTLKDVIPPEYHYFYDNLKIAK